MPIYCRCTCQTPGISWKDPVKQGLFVYPSYHLSGCFLGIGSLDFSEFWHGARNAYEVLHDNLIFGQTLTEFVQHLNFFFCCVRDQILYLGNILFLRYSPKCCQPIRVIFKSTISPEQIDETAPFLAC